MLLYEALELKNGDCVALVGAGGKTSLMNTLSDELSRIGRKVVITTTTHIEAPQNRQNLVIERDIDRIVESVSERLKTSNIAMLASGEANGQLTGIDNSIIPYLKMIEGVDNVIIVADGSTKKPFKAPTDYEPVIPPVCTVVVHTVGIDAIGSPLTAAFIHRPEIIAELTGLNIGDAVTTSIIAKITAHPFGGMKGKPADARFISVINKVEKEQQYIDARDVTSKAILNGVSKAVITKFKPNFQIIECLDVKKKPKTAAVVLAAGKSVRFGQPKLGLDLGGKTILHRVVENALMSSVSEVILVQGNREFVQFNEMARLDKLEMKRVKLIKNHHPDRGLSYSLGIGLNAVAKEIKAAIFMMGDQPFITSSIVDLLIAEYSRTRSLITAPYYNGKRGTPVVFDHVLFGALKKVQGDMGGREIINRYWGNVLAVTIDHPNAEVDIDTWEDYSQASDLFRGEESVGKDS